MGWLYLSLRHGLILPYSYTSLDNMQYIGFKLNGKEYTIPILKVREIIKLPAYKSASRPGLRETCNQP